MLILAGVLGAIAAGAALEVFSGGDDEPSSDSLAQEGSDDLTDQAVPDPDSTQISTEEDASTDDTTSEGGSPLGEVITGSGVVSGGTGDDTVTGSDEIDDLAGGAGNDTLSGLGEDDWIYGDDARDAWGDDQLDGGAGQDTLAGNGGNDLLMGGEE